MIRITMYGLMASFLGFLGLLGIIIATLYFLNDLSP